MLLLYILYKLYTFYHTKLTILDDGQPLSNMCNHCEPWSNMVKHVHPWSTMVKHGKPI
jgi:hypothetical protein